MDKLKSPKPERWAPLNLSPPKPDFVVTVKSGEDGVVYRRILEPILDPKPPRVRKIAPRQSAAVEKKIRAVLTHRQRWPENKRRLDDRQQARLLEAELRQTVDYDEETMRQIILGIYPAMKRRGIK
jgi:hypothetical protein